MEKDGAGQKDGAGRRDGRGGRCRMGEIGEISEIGEDNKSLRRLKETVLSRTTSKHYRVLIMLNKLVNSLRKHEGQKSPHGVVEQDVETRRSDLTDGDVVRRTDLKAPKLPWGANWRASTWFITLVVTMGTSTDILTYAIVVPVLPFRLQDMGYHNVSALTSWLLLAYSMGIVISTPFIAWFFHKHLYRRGPLVVAILVLEGALVLFMLAKPYWVMVLSRFLQGAAGAVIWTVGFALICENVDEKNMGRQIGFAMSGLSIGQTIAPPIGGALYHKLGWHAPFIFCIIICTVDLVLRLLVVEGSDLRKYEQKRQALELDSVHTTMSNGQAKTSSVVKGHLAHLTTAEKGKLAGVELSPLQIIVKLASSTRGVASLLVLFLDSMIVGALEPTLPLRVQGVWHKESDFVGLVYLAAAAPAFFAGPIIGALADKYGAEFLMFPSLIFSLPFMPLLLLKKSLAGFIVTFAFATLFPSCALAPTGLEVAMVARNIEGISEIHQFAAMNIAFAVSIAVGTVVGGQMYDHLPNGWTAVCWFCFGLTAFAIPFPFLFTGNKSLYQRLVHKNQNQDKVLEEATGDLINEREIHGEERLMNASETLSGQTIVDNMNNNPHPKNEGETAQQS
ncbi:uncharacterized protein L203_102893 [Cryptococcus depauperatus CBS 7841]|uniref:Major facilitator superfamily (MFS) profile domain-containing protein n=1 Tax=Cryptococcus depauperatus CBS 7841 TaxID=1295531 RepID=A0AAJ8M0R5_9TREE